MRLLERDFRRQDALRRRLRAVDRRALRRPAGRPAGRLVLLRQRLESDVGAADATIHGGDRIWWDLHDWGATPHVPAVVGSYPEPFAHGAGGKRYPVVLECADDVQAACTTVLNRLGAAGVVAGRQTLGTGVGEKTVRVFVGRWSTLRGDQALEQLDHGPASSGVYARFSPDGRQLGAARPARRTSCARSAPAPASSPRRASSSRRRRGPSPGPTLAGVSAAASALDERTLARRFALALDGSQAIGLPVVR